MVVELSEETPAEWSEFVKELKALTSSTRVMMLLENTRMREMMLKARMTFNPMNTSEREKESSATENSPKGRWDSQARGGSMVGVEVWREWEGLQWGEGC